MKTSWLIFLCFGFVSTGLSQSSLDTFSVVSPIGHLNIINCSKVRNNKLYTGSQDKTVKMWDLKSKKELLTLYPSNDPICDLDVTSDGKTVVTAHASNYVIIQEIHDNKSKLKYEFGRDEVCERVFIANDSLLLASLFNLSTGSSLIRVINLRADSSGPSTDISVFNDKVQHTADGKSWLYVPDKNTIVWNWVSRGIVDSRKIDFDVDVIDYSFDEVRKQLIIYDKHKFIVYGLLNHEKRVVQIDAQSIPIAKIDHAIPVLDNHFLLISQNRIYLWGDNAKQISLIGNLGSREASFLENPYDSTIYLSGDHLFQFNLKNNRLIKLLSIDDLETVNFECSRDYFSIQGSGIRVFNLHKSWKTFVSFSTPGKEKFELQLSENGKNYAIQNSSSEIEIFCLTDLSSYRQISLKDEILQFKVSDRGKIYVLDDGFKLSVYDPGKNEPAGVHLDFPFKIRSFALYDSLNQIWVLTSGDKLIKYDLNNFAPLSTEDLYGYFNESTQFSNGLNSYVNIDSDNYSFCELTFGDLSKNTHKTKIRCTTGVSEGAFTYSLSDDGKYLSYIDEDMNYLCVVDVRSTHIVNKYDINSFDELIDVAISDKNNKIVFSTHDDSVYVYDLVATQNKVRYTQYYAEVRDLKVDEVNRLLFFTSSDGNFYANELDESKPILSMYGLSSGDYMLRLPEQRFYMCSKNASKYLHYVTPSLKFVGFEQLDPIYNRPDVVMSRIANYFQGIDQALVSTYRDSWEKRMDRLGIDKTLLSNADIAVPAAEIIGTDTIPFDTNVDKLKVTISATDSKYSLKRFNVFVNEVPLYGSTGISITTQVNTNWDTTVSIPLSVGQNKIQVSVMNELGLENFKYPTLINFTPVQKIVPKTYFIGIGVNVFKDSTHNLKYCVKDVQDLSSILSAQRANIILLKNEQVTRDNILSLKKDLLNTSINDRVIISCSSHGLLDDSLNFYLAMHDVDFNNPQARGLKYEELESLFDGIPARQKLLLLDACNSGENDQTTTLKNELSRDINILDKKKTHATRGLILQLEDKNIDKFQKMNELFVNVRNNTGSVIIAAAGGQQSALEAVHIGGKKIFNGAFTYSVLEFLKQNTNNQEAVTVNNLKNYVEGRVVEITGNKQKPTSRQETLERDWKIFAP